MEIHETLSSLRKESKYSQQEVADYLKRHGRSVSPKAVSRWETGATMPDVNQFLLLCRLYGVDDVLTVFCDASEERTLNDLGRQRLLEYLRLLQSNDKYLAVPKKKHVTRQLPLYDLPVSAGTGIFLDSDRYELIDVDESVPLDATFAVRISGDSMEPEFTDQQIVYIKQQQTLEPGEIGIFVYNGEAYCKKLGGNNRVELISLNSDYASIVVKEYDELRVLGKVVA